MKRQRRHELRQNELLEWLNNLAGTVGPYRNAILGVLLLTALALGLWTWWTRQSATETAEGWDNLNSALSTWNPSEAAKVCERYPGSNVAHWAGVVAADMYLDEGCQQLFSNKPHARDQLEKAENHYKMVLKESQQPVLRQRATFGLARAYEAMAGTRQSQGLELDEAIRCYQELIKNWPQGTYAAIASRRLKDLKSHDTRAFYDEFAKYEPPSPFSDQSAMPGERPPFDLEGMDEQKLPDLSKALNIDLDDSEAEDSSLPEDQQRAKDTVMPDDSLSPEQRKESGPADSQQTLAPAAEQPPSEANP